MEQQVAEAALAMVRPTTDAATRAAASNFLENWNQTPAAWDIYTKWLASFSMNDSIDDMGTQLLCLTLLQAKIRREVPRGSTNINHAIYTQLLTLLQQCNGSSLQKPLCICTAALAVRCSDSLSEIITACQSATLISPCVALKLLACIPAEVEACQDLTTPQVTEVLFPYMEVVLDTCRRALASRETMAPALEALQ